MEEPERIMRNLRMPAVLFAVAMVATACSTSGGGSPAPSYPSSIGTLEDQLNLVAWVGYVEDGSNDPSYDWVHPFEESVGGKCTVNVKTAGTSNEMKSLMDTGSYDGVSASGNLSGRLVADGEAAPVNVDLIPNYADVFAALKDQPYNTFDGIHYGIPHGRGANLLAWRSDLITTELDSWGAVFDTSSPGSGKISVYDDPIYIADAAVYLKTAQPDLKITNPYELDQAQFDAAVNLLKQQRPMIGEYWTDATAQIQSFTSGTLTVGTTWQYQVNTMLAADPPVQIKAVLPKEGSTGWSDTWMVYSKAKHPNCMYKWMDWIISPQVNAQVAVWFGEAPSNLKACQYADQLSPGHCDTFHATDEAYFDKVYEWTIPTADCGDSRGSVCKDYSAWLQAWTEIKG
jgi:putative spermidine/putrescine transport system substrate-binding protein